MRYLLIICIFFCLLGARAVRAQSVDSLGTFGIATIRVDSDGEDRAMRIMRMAIASAPFHRQRVSEYSARSYVKGAFEVTQVSRAMKALAKEGLQDIKVGTRYVDESVGTIEFRLPNHIDQRVEKRATSIPASLRGENPPGLLRVDIYNPVGIFLSPLSPGAFAHYKFRYEGYSDEGGRIVNKILVVPTRHSSELVRGYIYIVEDEWSVVRFDLSGSVNIMSADLSYRLRTEFGDLGEGVWMPVRTDLSGEVKLLGSAAEGGYTQTTEYLRMVENVVARDPEPEQTVERNRQAYRMARREDRKTTRQSLDLTERMADNYKITIDSAALAPDTLFWRTARPEPLAASELRGYAELSTSADSPARRDTTAHKKPFLSKVLTGQRREKGLAWRGVVPSRVGFNTVDGFYFGIAPVSLTAKLGLGNDFTVRPDVGWAINRRALVWTVDARLRFAPMSRGEATLRVGSRSQDFAGSNSVDYTLPALFFRKNNLKLYEDNFVEASAAIDIANGLSINGSLKYSKRKMLDNSSDFSFFYRGKREYTPNIPVNDEAVVRPFDHSAAVMKLGVEYTPEYYYRVGEGRKEMVGSRWPTFFVNWQRGLRGIGGSETDFDHWTFGVKQNLRVGVMSSLDYFAGGGYFVHSDNLFFADYRHFGSTDFPLTGSSITSDNLFHLLPRYLFSTSHRYLEAHLYYRAPAVLIKNIPWFGKRLWQEGVQVNYLTTKAIHNYTELGYTVGLIWQAGIFVGFDNFKYRSFGVKVSLPLNQLLGR